jgi:hypothetical protein
MVTDPDGYFLIDPDSRVITTVSAVQNTLMQYDHESERYTFEVSRIVEGHDMMKCNRVRVHYNNIDSKTKREFASVDELTDLAVSLEDPSTVTCSWLIPRDATQYAGILSFLIQFMCVADDGTVVYEWHTDIYSDVEVKPGRRNGEQVVSPYNDLLEDWYQRLFGSKDSVMAGIITESDEIKNEIERKGEDTLESIPDDYTELYNTSRDSLRTRANAIVPAVSGDTIIITDSSDDHLRSLKVFGRTIQDDIPSPSNPVPMSNISEDGNVDVTIVGKNLLDIPNIFTYSSVKEFKVNLPVGTYILLWKKATKGGTNLPCFRCMVNDRWYELDANGKSITVVLDKPETTIYIYSNGSNASASVGVTSTIEDLMFSVDGGTYESYKSAQTISTQINKPLRGIPVESDGNYTDASGQQWVCDEIDFKRGMYVQRIKAINGNEISWVLGNENDTADGRIYYFPIEHIADGGLSNRFRGKGYAVWETLLVGEMIMYIDAATNYLVICVDKSIDTITSLNSWFTSNPTQFLYIPATPIETPLTEDELIQFKMAHTNFPNTTVFNDAGACMEVGYNADTETYLEQLPKATDEQVDSSVEKYLIEHSAEIDARLGDINAILATLSDGGVS